MNNLSIEQQIEEQVKQTVTQCVKEQLSKISIGQIVENLVKK